MTTLPFHLPLGDELLAEEGATLAITRSLTFFTGGPAQVVSGRIHLSRSLLAFRGSTSTPHPQQVTVGLADVKSSTVVRNLRFGFVPSGGRSLRVLAAMGARPLDLRFTVSDPEAWARRILQAQSSPAPPAAPAEAKLEAALRDGIHERGRYVATLADLSFPQAFWHPEALDDILPTIAGVFDRLGASAALGADFYATLALAVEIRYGPGDDVDAIESAERREQITRIMRAANAALAAAGHPKRFHNFTEDLPDWDFDEPVWLFLTDAQRASLLRLDILRPLPTPAPAGHSG